MPVNYLHRIPRFYDGADRAEIIWEDAEVHLFCQRAPELHAYAVRLARETGLLRICDLVELERSEIKKAPDGAARSSCARTKATAHREHAADPCRGGDHRQGADLAPSDPEAEVCRRVGLRRLSRQVREYATKLNIRPELRFNDLRGTRVTEMVWAGIRVPDVAIRIGWKIETAAKMLGVYAALNPGAVPRLWPFLRQRSATTLPAEDPQGDACGRA